MIKNCVICGAEFHAPPTSKKITCSAGCSRIRKHQTHKGKGFDMSQQALERFAPKRQTAQLKLGTEAARKSPKAGPFETNVTAKVWVLVSPEGEEIVVRNLQLWAREHAALFGKEQNERSAIQIACGFRAIARSLAGKLKRPAMTYFGWSLKAPPSMPGGK